jgi:hypothetical protein
MARDESRRRDLAGRVTQEDVEVSRTILVNGIPFEQLVERNGQPPSVAQERHQQEEIDKLKRETPAQRAERVRTEEEENLSIIREVPKAFDFQLVGEEVVNRRPAYVLQATPHPGYHARGRYGKTFAKLSSLPSRPLSARSHPSFPEVTQRRDSPAPPAPRRRAAPGCRPRAQAP